MILYIQRLEGFCFYNIHVLVWGKVFDVLYLCVYIVCGWTGEQSYDIIVQY